MFILIFCKRSKIINGCAIYITGFSNKKLPFQENAKNYLQVIHCHSL